MIDAESYSDLATTLTFFSKVVTDSDKKKIRIYICSFIIALYSFGKKGMKVKYKSAFQIKISKTIELMYL